MPGDSMRACIDRPTPETVCDPLHVAITGWVLAGGAAAAQRVEAYDGDRLVGGTTLLYDRPDVCAALGLAAPVPAGFTVMAALPHRIGERSVMLELRAAAATDAAAVTIATVNVVLATRDYRRNHFGAALTDDQSEPWNRSQVFGSGPSLREGSPECLALLMRYLGAPPCAVIDIGCGLGYYGRHLLAAGYAWLGVERKDDDCRELALLGLPHRRVDGRTLPFEAGAFECGLCIEVLEHVHDLDAFLAEARRVVRRRLIVSVPNAELIAYLQDVSAVPWHMLEADHHHFFSRPTLARVLGRHFRSVEVFDYAPHPIRTSEGLELPYHLLAVATA